jgi:hypothetical protein
MLRRSASDACLLSRTASVPRRRRRARSRTIAAAAALVLAVTPALAAYRLAPFKVPVRVIIVDSLPTVEGPNGVKVRRDELRRIAQATIDAPR